MRAPIAECLELQGVVSVLPRSAPAIGGDGHLQALGRPIHSITAHKIAAGIISVHEKAASAAPYVRSIKSIPLRAPAERRDEKNRPAIFLTTTTTYVIEPTLSHARESAEKTRHFQSLPPAPYEVLTELTGRLIDAAVVVQNLAADLHPAPLQDVVRDMMLAAEALNKAGDLRLAIQEIAAKTLTVDGGATRLDLLAALDEVADLGESGRC